MKKVLSVFMAFIMLFTMFTTTSVVSFAEGVDVAVVSETEELGFFQQVGKFFDDLGNVIKKFFEDLGKVISDFFNSIFGTGEDTSDPVEPPETELVEDPSKWTTEEILEYYQDATAKVVAEKPGYTKTRSAVDKGYNAGAILTAFKGEVFKFLGIGAENKFETVVAKGTNTNDDKCGEFLNESTLTAYDVTTTEIIKDDSCYVITIDVKPGMSQTEGGKNAKNNSPIDKSGICIGITDRQGFDHKNALIVYDALDDIAAGLTMYEKSNNGKVVATIDAATGEITKLVISWDASAEISKVYGSEAILSTSTTVTYTDFGWDK